MRTVINTPILAIVVATSIARVSLPSATAAPPIPPSGFGVVDLIDNHDYEDASAPIGFKTISGTDTDGSVARTTVNPIAGTASVKLGVNAYGRIVAIHDFGWNSGRFADSVVFDAKVRVEGAVAGGGRVEACAIVYFHNDSEPRGTCRTLPADPRNVVDLSLTVHTHNRQLRSVFAQFTHAIDRTTVTVVVDDVHLYVVERWGGEDHTPTSAPTATAPMPPFGGMGEHPSSRDGRHVLMIAPSNGETFVAPLNLRLVASGYDDRIHTNHPGPGQGTNASSVQWYLDDSLIFEQRGPDAEFRVFKGFVRDLKVQPGTYRVWARAIYVNPGLVLDSQPFTITVQHAPAYAQTIELSQDVVLSASRPSYQLDGTGGRVRLNGNCHAITGRGTLTLRNVDVYNLGSCTDAAAPGIEIASSSSVTIEGSTFDNSNRLALALHGTATASIRGNTFRSNMRMPIGQHPYAPSTYAVLTLSGSSTAPKTLAGNRIGAGPVHFAKADNWLTGGSTNADSNILIGPRTGLVIDRSSHLTVRGNFLHHVYDGGWSQGELLEVPGTSPILVEHNVLRGSSWPVRNIAGEFRYNLVTDGGHTWMVPGENAYIHHNVFVACDECNWAGIAGLYDVKNVRIENNTFDATASSLPAVVGVNAGSTTLRSNAFFNVPASGGSATVDIRPAASVNADYNGFSGPRATYSDGRTPAHDLAGGAPTNPRFGGPFPPLAIDERAVWQGTLSVGDILSAHRARYTPTPGSPYIHAGDPAGGMGNDIGAVGAGQVHAADQFGGFGTRSERRPRLSRGGCSTSTGGRPPGARTSRAAVLRRR